MLPVHIFNQIVLENQDRREAIRQVNLDRRFLRQEFDVFVLPDDEFVNLFRLTKALLHNLFTVLAPFLQKESSLAVDPRQKILVALYFFLRGFFPITQRIELGR